MLSFGAYPQIDARAQAPIVGPSQLGDRGRFGAPLGLAGRFWGLGWADRWFGGLGRLENHLDFTGSGDDC